MSTIKEKKHPLIVWIMLMPSQIRDGVKWPKLTGNRPRAARLLQTLEPQKRSRRAMGPTSIIMPTFLPLIMSPSHYLTVKTIVI
jgi:hypothetical protein